MKRFDTHKQYIELVEKMRWGNGKFCPICGESDKLKTCKDKSMRVGYRYNCGACRKSFSITTGTLFHHTRLSLQNWISAILMELDTNKELTSHQLSRDLGVTQKTAFRMLHKIREAMKTDQALLLQSIVDIEKATGGKQHYKKVS